MNGDLLYRRGAAPYIIGAAAVWFVGAGLAALTWPDRLVAAVPFWLLFGVAGIFFGAGLALLSRSLRELNRARTRGVPATWGAYSLCRHPVYAAWILFMLPAVAIVTGAWPMLGLPLAGWLGFKAGIGREECELIARFGDAYEQYRGQTRELLPLPPKDDIHDK